MGAQSQSISLSMQVVKRLLMNVMALVASVPQVTSTATQGCSNFQNLAGQSISGSFASGSYTRTFTVDFPRNYGNANTRGGSPLVVAYHGATRDIAYIKTQTQFSNPTLNPDHVVVYPQGIRNYWQGECLFCRCCYDMAMLSYARTLDRLPPSSLAVFEG